MKKRTFIAVVLDQSASMEEMRKEAIEAFNDQVDIIKGMQTEEMDVLLTLVVFSTEAVLNIANQKIDILEKMADFGYRPHGFTALYDGVALAIDTIVHEDENEGDAYLVSIISDGEENCSQNITSEQLANRITELQKKGNWTFTYLGANQDLTQVAKETGIEINNIATFVATPEGMKTGVTQYIQGLSSYSNARKSGKLSKSDFFSDTK